MDEDRKRTKRDAELAMEYRARLIAKGDLTREEVNRFTVAWILSRSALPDDDRQPWETSD